MLRYDRYIGQRWNHVFVKFRDDEFCADYFRESTILIRETRWHETRDEQRNCAGFFDTVQQEHAAILACLLRENFCAKKKVVLMIFKTVPHKTGLTRTEFEVRARSSIGKLSVRIRFRELQRTVGGLLRLPPEKESEKKPAEMRERTASQK